MRLLQVLTLLTISMIPALAQQPQPAMWAGAGVAYNQYAAPQINGWFSYATQVRTGFYSFTSWDVTSSTKGKFTPQTSVRTGFAFVIRQMGPLAILGFGDGGVSESQGDVGGAMGAGGIGILRLKHNWTAELAVRTLKTSTGEASQRVYEIGFGKTF